MTNAIATLHVGMTEAASFEYTERYCEENIYKLLLPLSESLPCPLTELTVVFISNANRMIPLWSQKLQREASIPVLWDYHVILHHPQYIYDFDSTLPFQCKVSEYIEETLRPKVLLREDFQRKYRLIPAKHFLVKFSSDRSHMLNGDGEYISPPPTWPLIHNEAYENNLQQFIEMGNSGDGFGRVLQEHEFLGFCRQAEHK